VIRHVVMWTLKEPADAPRFKALLDSCAGLVPGMLAFEVGTRSAGHEANVDVVLVSSFSDAVALQAYLDHPRHREVSAVLGPMRVARSVLDFPAAGLQP
jgi:Stress responsive A/B Barrel Domain